MSAQILPFRAPQRRYTTGDARLLAKRYREKHEALRHEIEVERFFREVWLKEFEAEFPEFGNREFMATMGLT